MSLVIRTYPDPCLNETAEEVTEISDELRQLAKDMADTMYANNGIGLAAPQVGELIRFIVVDISGPENRSELISLINPRIVHSEGEVESEEGCLSVPSIRTQCMRAEKVTVVGKNLDGEEVTIDADGLLAVCLQHELDHLGGLLIVNHMSRLKKNLYDKKVKKWQNQKQDES